MSRPKLHGDRDRLIPAALRDEVLAAIAAVGVLDSGLTITENQLHGDQITQLRGRIGIMLADQAGLRAQEICNLKVTDCRLDREPYDLLIRGAKHRPADHVDTQPIGPELRDALKYWLREAKRDWFVLTRGQTGLSRQWLWRIVKRIHAANDLPEIFGVHSWRHGYLTRFYLETKDLVLTSKMARHRSTKPTEKYVHMAEAGDAIAKALEGIGRRKPPPKKSTKTPRKKKKK